MGEVNVKSNLNTSESDVDLCELNTNELSETVENNWITKRG